MENIGFITLLNQYPDINPTLVKISSVFSVIKSSGTTIYFISLIVVLITFLIQALSKKKAKKNPARDLKIN
jgi:phage shock protein PspC (stress-responsive transcriptional regulator)